MGNILAPEISPGSQKNDHLSIYPPNTEVENPTFNDITDATNAVSTTKYTVFNFVPKNFWEQVTTRWANIYFILIAFLNFLPWAEVISPILLTLPVACIMLVTMVKDAYEDYRRHLSDEIINNQAVLKFDYLNDENTNANGSWIETTWSAIRPGDVIRIISGEFVPADVLILNSSEEGKICYLQTSNLDGESNLKQYQAIQETQCKHPMDEINFLSVNYPTAELYNILGQLTLKHSNRQVEFNSQNVLLRGCTLRNTDQVECMVLFTGKFTKTMMNTAQNKRKTSQLEAIVNKMIPLNFFIMVFLSIIISVFCYKKHSFFESVGHETLLFFSDQKTGPEKRSALNISLTNALSFFIGVQTLVPIALYVTWETVKLCQVWFIEEDLQFYGGPDMSEKEAIETGEQGVRCQAMNITEDLGQIDYIFSDKTGTLTENVMKFRTCSCAGVQYHKNTSQDKNHSRRNSEIILPRFRRKLSRTDDSENVTVVTGFDDNSSRNSRNSVSFQVPTNPKNVNVNVELKPKTSHHSLSGEKSFLGIIPGIQNKISSLSINNMIHKGTIKVEKSHHDLFTAEKARKMEKIVTDLRDPKFFELYQNQDQNIINFLTCIVVCHSALVAKDLSVYAENEEIRYESESPDELALLEFCKIYGVTMKKRTKTSILVEYKNLKGIGAAPGASNSLMREFKILHVRKFISKIKRMGIVVQDQRTDQIIYFVKGADEVILEMTNQKSYEKNIKNSNIQQQTQEDINNFASQGLRTLCMAQRILSDVDYDIWRSGPYQKALDTFDEEIIDSSYNVIEQENMELLGGMGIEDLLQKNVPETIDFIRRSGIKIWVITGDKLETAINIGYSSKLLDQKETKLLTITNCASADEFCTRIDLFYHHFLNQNNGHQNQKYSIAIDGISLELIMTNEFATSKFINFINQPDYFSTAIICRATPKLKADVVLLIKNRLKVSTLAVGDGANDVSMIQSANVGVGIFGKEGLQAVMNSDFAVSKFHHLKRMLFVHGAQCYERSVGLVLYCIKKHLSLGLFMVPIMFWAAGYTIIFYDDLLYASGTTVWCGIHPFTKGIFDQFFTANTLEKNPKLYIYGSKKMGFSPKLYLLNVFYSIYIALVAHHCAQMLIFDTTYGVAMFSHCAFTITIVTTWFIGYLDKNYWCWPSFCGDVLIFVTYSSFQWFLVYFGNGLDFNMKGSGFLWCQFDLWLTIVIGLALTILPYYFCKTVVNYWNEDRKMLLQQRIDQLKDGLAESKITNCCIFSIFE